MPHRPAALAPALFVICWSLVLASVPGVSQAQEAPTPPFDAVVIEANTMVRSGAGRAYYEVSSLEVGAEVVVEAELFGWYKIECPDGVFCFVERKNVNVRGDGSLGIIETDGTRIYAAHATKGPADSYRELVKLNAGDSVEIVDEVNNSYKIKPPKNAYLFLPPGSIEPAANRVPAPAPAEPTQPEPVTPPAEAAPAEQAEAPKPPVVINPPVEATPEPKPEPVVVNPPAPKQVEPEPVTPTPTPEPAPTEAAEAPLPPAEVISFDEVVDPAGEAAVAEKEVDLLNDPTVDVPVPDVQVKTDATNEMLRAVEVAMLPYLSLPVEEQPIAKMVQGYADAAQIAQLSDSDMAIVRARLTQLERNRELATALAEADAVTAEVNEGQPDAETAATDPLADAETPAEDEAAPAPDAEATASAEEPTVAETPKAPTPPAVPAVASEYDAVGILTASTVHTGANQPVLLRLLDPTGKRTIAYLEPSEAVDTVQMIGRIVGIVGESVYDPTTRLNLIRPTKVDVLSAN
ncbi:MAG: hypothetical protein AAGA25_06265 [Planctomycetota bacterium]